MDADKEGLLLTQATSWVARYQEAARAVREEASEPAVHGYRIAARRLLALLALWRPLTYHPELERRLLRSVGRLSALRDAQVYAERFGKLPASTGNTHKSACRVPLLSRRLARWLAVVAQVQDARALAFLYLQHLALRLDEAQSALDEPIPCVGKSVSSRQQQLRRWHRLRLEIKQARYGVELLLDLGSGDPGWLSTLTHWQETTRPVAGLASMAAEVASRAGGHPQADETAAAVEAKDHCPFASTGLPAGGAGSAQTGDAGRSQHGRHGKSAGQVFRTKCIVHQVKRWIASRPQSTKVIRDQHLQKLTKPNR